MTLPQALTSCVRQAAAFDGRAPRSEYWFWQGFCVCLTLFCLVLGLPAGAVSVLSIALFVPSAAVCSRRLHDINMRGWWQILPMVLLNASLMVFGSSLTAAPDPAGEQASLSPLVGLVAGFLLWLYWGSKRGTNGENRFGLNPLGQTFFVNTTGETLQGLTLVPTADKDGKTEAAPKLLPNLLTEALPDGDAESVDVFTITLNRELWTLSGQSESGRFFRWQSLPVRTGRTYILTPEGVEDMPTPDLDAEVEENQA